MRGAAVFVDTSALYAAADSTENRHRDAAEALRGLVRGRVPLVTTDLNVAEFHALALRRLGPETALRLANTMMESPRLDVVATGSEGLSQALEFLATRRGRPYSLADAVSFLVMRDRQIEAAFTVDQDFAAEGYTVLPTAR